MAHEHLTFDRVQTIYDLTESDGKTTIRVAWEVTPGTGNTIGKRCEYVVTLTGLNPGKSKDYSLLTLGLQRVEWSTVLARITPTKGGAPAGTVQIVDGTGNVKPTTLTPAGRTTGVPHPMPIPNGVLFARISGADTVTFEVRESNQPRCGLTLWTIDPPSGGHDNNPPKDPPD